MSKDQKEICLYCKFWATEGRKAPTVVADYTIAERLLGECRHEAPAIGWPETFQHHWCGKFKDCPDDHESSTFEPIAKPAERVLEKLSSAE